MSRWIPGFTFRHRDHLLLTYNNQNLHLQDPLLIDFINPESSETDLRVGQTPYPAKYTDNGHHSLGAAGCSIGVSDMMAKMHDSV